MNGSAEQSTILSILTS